MFSMHLLPILWSNTPFQRCRFQLVAVDVHAQHPSFHRWFFIQGTLRAKRADSKKVDLGDRERAGYPGGKS